MTDITLRARLVNPQQAATWLRDAAEKLKPWLLAGHVFEVYIKREKRSLRENALLHAMLTYIANTQEWAGKKRDADTWKRLLVAAWCRANGESVELLPALDGCGVDIVYRRTSELTRAECADLISFIFAWGVENDIEFPPDPKELTYSKRLTVAEPVEEMAA